MKKFIKILFLTLVLSVIYLALKPSRTSAQSCSPTISLDRFYCTSTQDPVLGKVCQGPFWDGTRPIYSCDQTTCMTGPAPSSNDVCDANCNITSSPATCFVNSAPPPGPLPTNPPGSCDGCMDAGSCSLRGGSYGGAGSGGCDAAIGGYCSNTTTCGSSGGGSPPAGCTPTGLVCAGSDSNCCSSTEGCINNGITGVCTSCTAPITISQKCGVNPACGKTYLCHGITYYCPSTACTLTASVTANPSSGPVPLSGVSLTANGATNVPGGVYALNFYCGDNALNGGLGTRHPYSNVVSLPFVDPRTCTYLTTGTKTVTLRTYHSGYIGFVTSTTIVDVTVPAVSAWWQATNADVISGGNLISSIATGCSLPACNPILIKDGLGGFPGIGLYSGNYDFSADTTSQGTVSSKLWLTNTTYRGKTYDYNYFRSLVPGTVAPDIIVSSAITQGYLSNQGTNQNGYYWYERTGDLRLEGNITIATNRRTVVFVNGNLSIGSNVNFTGSGVPFVAFVVSGNINLDPAVTSLQGLYLANGSFATGSGSGQLTITGSVAALSGFTLQRDLGATQNQTTPAENFIYDPSFTFTAPPSFAKPTIKWREVAP